MVDEPVVGGDDLGVRPFLHDHVLHQPQRAGQHRLCDLAAGLALEWADRIELEDLDVHQQGVVVQVPEDLAELVALHVLVDQLLEGLRVLFDAVEVGHLWTLAPQRGGDADQLQRGVEILHLRVGLGLVRVLRPDDDDDDPSPGFDASPPSPSVSESSAPGRRGRRGRRARRGQAVR